MKPITHEWLTRATEDLAAAQMLLSRPDLTNVVAFHAQQAVEKALTVANFSKVGNCPRSC